jgi:signal transduction histidine kinase
MLLARTLAGPVYVFDRPVRLLVADDDPIMREFAVAQLSMPGGVIMTAGDGEEAWEILEREPEPFDLVLSDLEMPRANGFTLVDRIRRSPRHANLPVVVITSRDDMFAIDRAYEVGATSFVAKPVNWRLLGYQLRYVLRSSGIEAEVRSARDEAKKAAALKASLLMLLQHETRTPLHAITGYAELLQAGLLDPGSLRSYADNVVGAARSLRETLRRVFYFSQLTSGTLPLDREVTPLGHLVEEAVHACRARAAAAGVTVVLDEPGPDPLAVSCDVGHLSGALREILVNAVAHAPRDSAVAVGLRRREGSAVAEVRDRGPGMSPEILRRCQEPFGQEGDPLTRGTEGLGLGLPTARGVAEIHGGSFEIESTPGEGTTVRLVLPLAPPEPVRLVETSR